MKGLLEKGENVRVLTRSLDRASALPKGAEAVIGDLSGEGTPPSRTGVNIWQVQSLMKFAGVPWGFDPGWTASERGWR